MESRHPAGSTTTWGTSLLAASQVVTAFEVSGAPKRSTASGTIRSSMPTVASSSPEASTAPLSSPRRPDWGSASTGIRSAVASPATASASTGESAPTTATTRLPPTRASTSATAVRSGTTTPEATDGVGVVGGGDGAPAGSTSESSKGRLRWTGPGGIPTARAQA